MNVKNIFEVLNGEEDEENVKLDALINYKGDWNVTTRTLSDLKMESIYSSVIMIMTDEIYEYFLCLAESKELKNNCIFRRKKK